MNVTIYNYKKTKDAKRKNKGNQFMIVSGLSKNQNDEQYTCDLFDGKQRL